MFSGIGSYTSIGFKPKEASVKLGGQDYPSLIRREKAKSLQIFIQDGTNDIDNEWGNWFLANQQMVKAFEFANKNTKEEEKYKVKPFGQMVNIMINIRERCFQML